VAKFPPLFHDCVLAPQELLKFVSSSLSAYCENTAGLLTVGHATIFCDCVQAPQELLKFVSSSLSAYCENTAGLLTVGHATIFCVSLQRLSRPAWRLTRRSTTIICDILNHSQENFVIEIKQIS